MLPRVADALCKHAGKDAELGKMLTEIMSRTPKKRPVNQTTTGSLFSRFAFRAKRKRARTARRETQATCAVTLVRHERVRALDARVDR